MSLEERSIAATRRHLAVCQASELNAAWKEAETLKGGNQHVVFDEQLRRDVLAYTMLRAVELFGGFVFGGFVRAHCSGKTWRDIDVFVPDNSVESHVWSAIVNMVTFVLPVPKVRLRYDQVEKPSEYARTYKMCILGDHQTPTIEVCVDLVKQRRLHGAAWVPVTIGSCLRMSRGVVTLRDIKMLSGRLSDWRAEEIVEMLQNGVDIKLCFHYAQTNERYKDYYWTRVQRMLQDDWTLQRAFGIEPEPHSKRDLEELLQDLSVQ